MPASFNGAVTLGGCCPGLQDAFNEVGSALETLRDEVLLHIPCFTEAIDAMAGVRLAAVSDFQAQLTASVNIQLQLKAQLANPAAYLAQLLAALENLLASLPTQLPVVALGTQIAAAAAVEAVFAAKIAAVDAQISIVVNLLSACSAALLAVSAAAFNAIEKFHTFRDLLNTSGAYAFSYTGQLGSLGAALDLVTPASGLGATATVQATIQVTRSSTSASDAQSQLFLVA